MTIQSLQVLPLVFGAYAAGIAALWITRARRYGVLSYLALTTFVVYLLLVAHFVFFPIHVSAGSTVYLPFAVNLLPLPTLDLSGFMQNIVLMIPFGLLLPALDVRINMLTRLALAAFLVSLLIEITQLLLTLVLGSGHTADINDLVANTLGGVLGYGLLRLLSRLESIRRLAAKTELRS